jgi:hypothetical protein
LTLFAAIDPGRSKCGLVLADSSRLEVLAAGVLPPQRCREQLMGWIRADQCSNVVLGDGTGSPPWRQWLLEQQLAARVVPEAGTTLAARDRYWELEPARGWRRLLPKGLRLPPRDVDDVVAQILLERHLNTQLTRPPGLSLLAAQNLARTVKA